MLLLDTHAFVWLASDTNKLSDAAKAAIQKESGSLFISGITGLEITLASKRNRLILPVDPNIFIRKAMLQHGIRQIPVTVEIGSISFSLPDIHNDPFDRIIIATAQFHESSIVSKDSIIQQYPGIEVIW